MTKLEWKLIVLVPELDLLEDGEGNWINEGDGAINASRINNKHLLVGLLEAQEAWLRLIERLRVSLLDEVTATFIRAHSDPLLWEGRVLLNVPNLEDPVRVDRVDAAAPLVNDHIDNVVVLERWSSAKRHWCQLLPRGNIILAQLILSIEQHDLSESVVRLQRLRQHALERKLEVLNDRVDVLGHRPVLISCLNVTAHIQRLTVTVGLLNESIQYDLLHVLLDVFPSLLLELSVLLLLNLNSLGHLVVDAGLLLPLLDALSLLLSSEGLLLLWGHLALLLGSLGSLLDLGDLFTTVKSSLLGPQLFDARRAVELLDAFNAPFGQEHPPP